MEDTDRRARLDRQRFQIAWVVTGVWVASFVASVAIGIDSAVFAAAQAMMLLVAGWLFVKPAIRPAKDDDQ